MIGSICQIAINKGLRLGIESELKEKGEKHSEAEKITFIFSPEGWMERASERGRRAVDDATVDGSSTQRRLLTVLMSVHIDLSSSTLLIVKYQNYQLPLQFSSSLFWFFGLTVTSGVQMHAT